jgi:hypothetical protein
MEKPGGNDNARAVGFPLVGGFSGAASPTPSNQCWPEPVPYIFLNFGIQLLQQPHQITILYDEDHEVRHVRMNQPHPAQVIPSWYGDSVGHYEGDTLVIDTVGIRTDRPFAIVDAFGTPYSSALHVVERYRRLDYDDAKEGLNRNARAGGGHARRRDRRRQNPRRCGRWSERLQGRALWGIDRWAQPIHAAEETRTLPARNDSTRIDCETGTTCVGVRWCGCPRGISVTGPGANDRAPSSGRHRQHRAGRYDGNDVQRPLTRDRVATAA